MTTQVSQIESVGIEVNGMNCASCVAHVEKAARALPGVTASLVNLARGRATVSYDPALTDPTKIAEAISKSGYPAAAEAQGSLSADAEEKRLQRQNDEAAAWYRRATAGIVLWLPVELTHWVMHLTSAHAHHPMPAQSTWMGWIAFVSSTIAIVYIGSRFYASALGALRRWTSNMDTLISLGASVAYGYSLTRFVGGMIGWWTPPVADELYFMEASGLLALISVGHWLEARARQSAGSAIRQLLELAPAVAMRLNPVAAGGGGSGPVQLTIGKAARPPATANATPLTTEFAEVAVSELTVGDRLLVRPGDRIPIDGVVVDGQSSVDESMISGESIPVSRKAGDTVIGGTFNQDGRLIVRVSKVGSQTALAQIVGLVERAQSSKPPVQRLADQISAVFVPSVLVIALFTGVGWYAWGHGHHWPAGQIAAQVARTVCSVLIIACPCALGLAVPAAVMVGTGRGARRGILIRDIDALQNAERIDTVVLDKTGTITQGKPVVSNVTAFGELTSDEVLRLAASAEQFSAHPLAKAIVAAARERRLTLSDVAGFTTEAGMGIVATIDGRELPIGSPAMLAAHGLAAADALLALRESPQSPQSGSDISPKDNPVGSIVCVGERVNEQVRLLGNIAINDEIKSDSPAAIAQLHAMGLHTVMLTGDNRATAESIARRVNVQDVRAQVKPADKARVITDLQNPAKGASRGIAAQVGDSTSAAVIPLDYRGPRRYVAMVGDGINDAPALAAADLGIAVGGGSDIAKEAGGIVLVSGSLAGVAAAIRLSRATMRKIRQNLFLAFIYNVIAIPLAAFGLLNPLIAAGAMALSDVTVIGNALLLRRTKID